MNIARHTDEDVVRLALAGELDMATVGTLQASVEQALTASLPERLIIDLAGVTFCDSTGIGALLDARTAATGRGIAFQATNPRGITRRSLEVCGVLDYLTTAT